MSEAAQERSFTQEWEEYQAGLDYKRKLDLFHTVNKNERFYSNDQWNGVVANGLPTPVFNVIKRVVQYKVSTVMANEVSINYTVDSIDSQSEDPRDQQIKTVCELLSDFTKTVWERLKMDFSNEQILKDGALSGDGITYYYWDPDIDTGQEAKGDIAKEEIDNVCYFPGNTNDPSVQSQPYILITYRQLVSKLREEARKNGASEEDVKLITADAETENQAGDRAMYELEDQGENKGKAIGLLRLWKENGKVMARKSTRYVVIRKTWDTGRKRYPVAMMNWESRKNSAHGTAEVTGMIPNQIFINRAFAMSMMSAMHTAFPKLVYDSGRIKKPNNKVGEAIAAVGDGDVRNVAAYLTPGKASEDIYKLIEMATQYTKEMMGANEAALGEVDPKNTSAIIAVQQAAAIPLESIRRRFYNYIEDVALIWLDFFVNSYAPGRMLPVTKDGVTTLTPFDGSLYSDVAFRVKIDVGPSSRWSEITTIQTLDNLLAQKHITFDQYLERIPDGFVPKKQELIEVIKQQQALAEQQMLAAQQQAKQQQIEQAAAQLLPEEQAMLAEHPEVLEDL